ncbi:MAG: alpha/beta hydrolase [Candidatus Protochlamydia sp.]|nr:alpha/beta hydrolase [Candidatus Protochlamydia sp.]
MAIRKIFVLCFFTAICFSGCQKNHKVEVKKQNVNNIELAYYTRGSGEPLVMIMGFRGTMAMWDPAFLEQLEKKFTLILFDNRGVGFSSDTQKNEINIHQMAEDTSELIKALGYERAHVLGWSMGSRIAMMLAINHPEQVQTLILCSPNPGGSQQTKRKSQDYADLLSVDLSNVEGLSLIFPKTEQGEKASSDFVERLQKDILEGKIPYDLNVNSRTVERQIEALQQWDENEEAYESLAAIKSPSLVAGGLADVLDEPENVEKVAARIPFAWKAYFPHAGHNFLSQDHEDFARLVCLFIDTYREDIN